MKWLRRLLPAPLLSVSLALLWLVLDGGFGLGQWVIAVSLGLAVPLMTASLRPSPVRIRHPWTIVRLVAIVGRDVVMSNINVAAGVLRANRTPPRGTFVSVPIALRDPHAIAALAMIMCVIPGTVWSQLSLDRGTLLLHVFDLDDEAEFIAHLKSHYEQPLMEIFE